jgi:hypothetical protein
VEARRRVVCRASFELDLPVSAAFRYFTPRGEREWADGWDPAFPVEPEDDAEPGTVFRTSAHGAETLWVVAARPAEHAIVYARVAPGDRAGTVTVACRTTPRGGTEVEVTYDLTALEPAGDATLAAFERHYPEFIEGWRQAISRAAN